jgi:endogenous inhibitor of DNA gyrase (YacG/DUF329 family)
MPPRKDLTCPVCHKTVKGVEWYRKVCSRACWAVFRHWANDAADARIGD